MRILTLNGSPAGRDSVNGRLLAAFAKLAPHHEWSSAPDLGELPLFSPGRLASGRPKGIASLAREVAAAEAVIVSTPEYAHNLPAALKSALEWLVASGEFAGKPVVAMTATPAPPRGEHCMRSLVTTLRALDARVLLEAHVYAVAGKLDSGGQPEDPELRATMEGVIGVIEGR